MLEGENADLKEEVEELKAQIASAEAASDTLRTEVDGLKAQLANAETTSDTIRVERDEAQRRLADITRQLRDMTSARDKLQGQLTALQTRERELQARLTSRGTGASSPAGAVTAALEDCEREKGVLSSRLAEIEEKLARKKKEHEDKFNKLKEEMDDPARKNFDQEKKDLELRITELEELLKREQDDHKDTAEQLEDCRRHRGGDEDLKKKVEELEREIQALKKRARELEAERDRMRSHRDQRQKERDRMEEELVREMDKRRQLEARIAELEGRIVDSAARIVELEAQLAAKQPDDDRVAELERRIAELIQSRLDLIEYFTNKMKEIEDNSRRYQAIRDERLAEFERERDQFARQMGTVRDRINANPGAPDVGNYQRRSEFLQAEIKKLQDRIKTLKDERVWFEDLAITSQEAQERAEEAVVEAREALDEARRELQDRNRIGIANARRQRDDAAAPEPPVPQPRWFPWYLRPDSWGYTNLGWNRRTARLLYEPFLMFVVISIGIAFGREYATWQNANDYQRRALYAMHKERYTVCLVTPDWYLLWEFFAVILTGSWAWSAI
ncbi:hypothetical protein F4821DRAFT_241694 [Hypoxylon rubiginosum]|uniref:Uncharacterized protein n=1 Tax=Hypoxylon rubiginosum TaxID=110542 RepID=A0ACC0CX18_9PEZI|nr:hypothetical protein F4821DRAFT_241694 [Hypoxylon rubiginosum]